MDHLLIHCSITRDLWAMVFGVFGVQWVMLKSVLDMMACWQGSVGRYLNVKIWKAVPHCLMWCFWKVRNARSFEGCERSFRDLKLFFFKSLYEWMTALGFFLDSFDHCTKALSCCPIVYSLCTSAICFPILIKFVI